MSVNLTKTQVAISNAEGLVVLMTAQPAGSWATNPTQGVPFLVETVVPGRPGEVFVVGEYQDEIGGGEWFNLPATKVLALA